MLDKQETSIAASQGWILCRVWLPESSKTIAQILAVEGGRFANSQVATAAVMGLAKTGDALAVRALQAMFAFNNPQKPTKKK